MKSNLKVVRHVVGDNRQNKLNFTNILNKNWNCWKDKFKIISYCDISTENMKYCNGKWNVTQLPFTNNQTFFSDCKHFFMLDWKLSLKKVEEKKD